MIEVRSFPEFHHLCSTDNAIILFDIKTSTLLELDYYTSIFVEEAVMNGSFSEISLLNAKRRLRMYNRSNEEIEESLVIVEELLSKGYFANDVRDHDYSFYCNTITLNISQKCQLNCAYCFASGGDYGNNDLSPLMTIDIAKRSIDFLFKYASPNVKKLGVIFFGGEPLINWDALKTVTFYAEEKSRESGKDIKFSITTNADLITDEIADFFVEHHFSILVSIDGDEKLHNALRPHVNSDVNSYLETRRGIDILNRKMGYVVGNATVTSVCSDLELISRYLRDAGITYMRAPLASVSKNNPLHVTWEQAEEYTRQLETKMFEEYFDDRYLKRVKKGVIFRWGCSFARSNLGIDSDGRVYPCPRLTSQDQFLMGSVFEGIDIAKAQELIENSCVDNMVGCRSCWVRYLCGGGCPAENFVEHDSISIPRSMKCYVNKKMYVAAIARYLSDVKKEAKIG